MRSLARAARELYRYRALIGSLVNIELKVRYRSSFFGFLWTLINPLLLMLVLWFVFSHFRVVVDGEKNYALRLLAGIMLWTMFSQSISRSLTAIIKNKNLLKQIYIPKAIFPISIVTSNLVNLLFSLVAYAAIAMFTIGIPITVFALVPAVVMLFVLSTGASLLMASLNTFFRDFTHLTEVLLRALFYLTPIFYRPELFGDAQWLLQLNPLFFPIELGRAALYEGTLGTPFLWTVGFAYSGAVLLLGAGVFLKTQDKFVYYA